MKRIIWALQAVVFYGLTLVAAYIPLGVAYRLGAAVGLLIPLVLPSRLTIARDNISRALPFMKSNPLWNRSSDDPAELAREMFRNLGLSLVEVCRLYHAVGEPIISRIEMRGREHYEAARAKGKGVLLITGHCGNWELLALAISSIIQEGMSVVARRQNNPYLNQMVERMRMRYNSAVIYKQGALRGILATLKKKGIVGILADQAVLPEEGVLISVLGRTAWASKAPVLIALKSGAPVIPTFIHREADRQVITFHPEHQFSGDASEEGIIRETKALSRYVEDYIAAYPTQWYWVHRRWKRAGETV